MSHGLSLTPFLFYFSILYNDFFLIDANIHDCSLDTGRSECELVNCMKAAGFKETKCLEKSSICHQGEVCHFTGGSSYDILIQNYDMKNMQ